MASEPSLPAGKPRLARGLWWGGFAAIAAVSAGLSAYCYAKGLLPWLGDHDKAVHFTLAGLLAFFLDGALARRAVGGALGASVPVAALAVLVPAGIDEIAQAFTPLRTSSFADYAADVLGVVVFIALSRRVAA